jgi:outer membrane receptor protein involved in Fe transport
MHFRCARELLLASISLLALLPVTRSLAQDSTSNTAPAAGALEEITVTARKREESAMQAPVVLQVVSGVQIEDLHVNNIYAIESAVPGLMIGQGIGSVGVTANLRGLGNGQAANYVDQSVGLNIDGIGVSGGQFFRGGLFDMAQFEVLKGPQALFFGKSTSAGVIALHSADPTSDWEMQLRSGYEFNADEFDFEGFVSGPITDTLGFRLAGYHSQQVGWFVNPNSSAIGAHTLPDGTADGERLTLKFDDPGIGLRVNFKASYNRVQDNSGAEYWFHDICSNGVSSVAFYNQFPTACRGFTKYTNGDPSPRPYIPGVVYPPFDPVPFQTSWPNPIFGDGIPYQYTDTSLNSLSIDYEIMHGLTLTSVTGFSYYKTSEAFAAYTPTLPYLGLASRDLGREYTEEVRLASSWKSWINFMVGGLYDWSQREDSLALPLQSYGIYTDNTATLNTGNNSAFGQLMLTPIDKWELDMGVRYTEVDKTFVSVYPTNNYSQVFPPNFTNNSGQDEINNIPWANRHLHETATTPEVTITYRPTDDVTTFVSWKKGYKGPGFNFSLTDAVYSATSSNPFPGERAKGEEGGIKAQLLDRHLALTLSGYRYDYTGLQVAIPNNVTVVIKPDANARVQGVELGVEFAPVGFEALTLSAALNYNDAYYTSWPDAPCWSGQLLSQGCLTNPVTGVTTQNLIGKTLSFAPPWTGSYGVDYKWNVASKYRLSTNVSGTFSSWYNAVPEQNPNGHSPGYVTLDAALRFGRADDGWEVALLGRNLTNKLYGVSGEDRGILGPATGIAGDAGLIFNRPWQVMLQITVRPDQLWRNGWR